MGFGDDFRLMTRVLPRPIVLQGGKSMGPLKVRVDFVDSKCMDVELSDVWRAFPV